MSGFSRDRNIKIPKKGEKKSSSTRTDYLPTRPAEGRVKSRRKLLDHKITSNAEITTLAKITKDAGIAIAPSQGNKNQDRKDQPPSMKKFGQE